MSVAEFSVQATWRKQPKPEARDVAELRLAAGEDMLTRLIDLERKEERDYVRSSAVSLALWFADNWWRLRHESLEGSFLPSPDWRLRHELPSASGGTLWPPIMFHSTGERVLITPTYGRPLDLGAVRHILPEVKSISGEGYEAGVDAFFIQVLGVCGKAQDGAALAAIIDALNAERADPDIAAWRRLEARLGFDPDRAPDAVMERLARLEKTVGEAGLEEAAAAAPGGRSAEMLEKVISAAKESEISVDFEVTDNLPRDRIRTGAAPPWKLGRDAAFQVRQAANLRDGPIKGRAFADLFKVRPEDLKKPATARDLSYAARLHHRGRRQKLSVQSPVFRNRRFELACALGDSVWLRADFGVVSSAKTDRQKFQRAFAQNLLAPYSDVKEHIDPQAPTEDQVIRAGRHFEVHENVIRRLLVLEGVLPKTTFEDQLEGA